MIYSPELYSYKYYVQYMYVHHQYMYMYIYRTNCVLARPNL